MNSHSGEPPPPGFEDEITRVAEIEKVLKSYKGNALIGLEYTVEIQENRGESGYQCVLCDKRGDPRTIVQHWTSYLHRLKYLEKHFPTAIKSLDSIRNKSEKMKTAVQKLSEAIERHHGRQQLIAYSGDDYRRMKTKIFEDVKKRLHHDEKNGPDFVDAIDPSLLQSAVANKKKESEGGLDEISSDSDGNQTGLTKSKKREQSPAYRIIPKAIQKQQETANPVRNVKALPTPKELSLQASHIAQEKYKWEKYRCMLEIYLKQVETQHKEYEKNPEKHPMYPEEWKAFWNRRYKELQKEKKVDPNKYDYKPEWALFWSKRTQELYNEDIEKKKAELKQKLELTDGAEEKIVDKLKEQYKLPIRTTTGNSFKTSGMADNSERISRNRQDAAAGTGVKVINISDDESPPKRSPRRRRSNSPRSRSHRRSRSRSPLRYERKRPRKRSRSRSISPFSDDYEYESRHQYERGLMAHRRAHQLPPAIASRRYGAPLSPRQEDYYEGKHAPYKHSQYSTGNFRNGKDSFQPSSSSLSKYDRISMSPPPAPKSKITPKQQPEPEPEPEDEGPLTVVAVLRLLTALEDNLGSLGPKMIDLLGKALALENVKANSSDDLLMNDDICVFFETAKEKLKGLLIAEVIEDPQKVRAVKKAIRNIATIVHQVQTQGKSHNRIGEESASTSNSDTKFYSQANIKDLPFDRQLVASKLAAALVTQGREDLSTADVDKLIYLFILMVKLSKGSDERLHMKDIASNIGVFVPQVAALPNASLSMAVLSPPTTSSSSKLINERQKAINLNEDIFDVEANEAEISNDASDKIAKNANAEANNSSLESLTDSDLQTLLQNFKHLSTEEQHHLIAHLKKLETADPTRVEKLRKYVNLGDVAESNNSNLSSSAQQRARNDASHSSSTASNRAASSASKNYDDDSPRGGGSMSRDRSHFSDDDDVDNVGGRSGGYRGSGGGNGANPVNPNRFTLDDEDDDDYNFDEVIKVASSNVDKRAEDKRQLSMENGSNRTKNPASEPPAPGTLNTSAADALAFNRAAMNINLNDTQNLIANLMGNLNQSKQKTPANNAQKQAPPPPMGSQQSLPFYQQHQQQFGMQQQYPGAQQQQPFPQQQQQQPFSQQQQPYGNYMGNNQGDFYNNAYNNNSGYPQGSYPAQMQQQWPNNQHAQQPPQHQMGYNMYGGN